jgi:transposase
MPAQQDEQQRAVFQGEIGIIKKEPAIDYWYSDESGFEGDPIPRRVLCLKGARPIIPYTGSHIRSNVIGAVRPRDGKFVSLIMPYVDTEIFQIYINELHQYLDKSKRNIIILDNARWHITRRLNWGLLEVKYLPAYSPDFNPIERLWLDIKNNFFTWFSAKTSDELDNHLEESLKFYIKRSDLVKSICGGC